MSRKINISVLKPHLDPSRVNELTFEHHVVAIQLVDGRHKCEGRVEVYYNSQWGTVCDDYWDYIDADVVCRELGFTSGTSMGEMAFGAGYGPIWLGDVNCTSVQFVCGTSRESCTKLILWFFTSWLTRNHHDYYASIDTMIKFPSKAIMGNICKCITHIPNKWGQYNHISWHTEYFISHSLTL